MINKFVVVTGGGTGGHLKVADAFIEELYNRQINIVFIGSLNGQDKSWFENDYRIKKAYFLDTKGVVNKQGVKRIFSLINIFIKIFFCLKIYYKYNIKEVISVGGFSAAAASFACILKRNCKLYIHEQNSRIGKLNQITSKFAEEIFSSFDNKSLVKDYPVSKQFFELSRIRSDIKTIAFFGGSQGAVFINDFALKLAPTLNKMKISIIHQTGKNDYERIKQEYKKLNIKADVFDFSKDMPLKMQKADFAVSRAGASTLWELCANCLPTFFIPYKFASSNHQYYNAKVLFDKNLCFLQNEEDLSEQYFIDALESNINKISLGLKESIKQCAVKNIVDYILKN